MNKNNILIIVDMQNDFIDGSLGTKEAKAIVKNVIKEMKNKEYDGIYLTEDKHFDNYLNTLEGKNLPIEHCIKGTKGSKYCEEIVNLIKRRLRNKKMINIRGIQQKTTFGSLSLPEMIKDTEDKIDSITICGLCTDVCVISNALILRAAFPDVPMYYVENACAGTTPEKHKAACEVMESCQIYKKR